MENDKQVKVFTPYIDRKQLPMITIYNTTTLDYPGQYVARLRKVIEGKVYISNIVVVDEKLENVRASIPEYMIKTPRCELDAECIIETYI